MGNRPIKIKRNTSISGKKRQRNAVVKRVLGIVFVFAGLFAIGFLGAPAVMDLIDEISSGKPPVVQPQPSEEPQLPSGEDSEGQNTENPGEEIAQATPSVYYQVDTNSLLTDQGIQAAAQTVKDKGADTAVITLKDSKGYIYWDTKTQIGSAAKAPNLIDVGKVCDIFKQNGLKVAVRIYAFEDSLAPGINRETAVKYQGTDYNWLDTSKEFGGKPWANPASAVMQEYLYSIVEELGVYKIDQFIFSSVQLPTGYSLDKRDFGVSEDQLKAQMQGFIKTMQSKAQNSKAYFEFDVKAVKGEDYAKYIIPPQQLGAENIIITGSSEDFGENGAVQLAQSVKNSGYAENTVICFTDKSVDKTAAGDSGYFVK